MKMNLEKIFYLVVSTVLVTMFVLIVFIFSPVSYDHSSMSGEKVIYFADNISPAHQAVINRFNKQNEGKIRVETINLPFEKFSTNERKELLARYLRSKSSRIDLFSVDVIWVPRFSRWALPLDHYIDTSLVNTLLPFTLQTCMYRDSLVALPLYTDISVMFYRKDILEALPSGRQFEKELSQSITWERFAELKNKIAQTEGRGSAPFYYIQADAYEGLICSLFELNAAHGNMMISGDGRVLTQDGILVKSIAFLQSLVYSSGLVPAEVTKLKENDSYELFFKNNAFAVRGWPGFMSKTNAAFKQEFRGKIQAVPVPHPAGAKRVSVFGGWNLMISRFSNNVPEVIRFLNFLFKEENQKLLFEAGYLLPTNRNLYNNAAYIQKHPELKFYEELFSTGVYRPMLEDYTSISDILASNINEAITNNSDPAKVVKTIEQQTGGR